MKIISFAWATSALLARRKTCTRRNWNEKYARSFQEGELVQAWDKLPRAGGKRIGTIRLTEVPMYQPLILMPKEDYEAEGFKFFDEHPELVPKSHGVVGGKEAFLRWRMSGDVMWVIRFEVVELYYPPM